MLKILVVAVMAIGLGLGTVWSEEGPAKVEEERGRALAVIQGALSEGDEKEKSEAELKRGVYEKGVREALPWLKENVMVTRRFKAVLAKVATIEDAKLGAKLLWEALRDGEGVLAFRMVKEAELPVGFPEPTPVGEIRLKKYPAYRMAAAKQSGETFAFWTLFGHIKKNEIAMTAPVEMTFGESEKERGRMKQMAFLYGSQEIGQVGKDGAVNVVDVEPMLTVSIGMRGEAAERGREEARGYLEEWLKEHAKEYRAAGPLRMMGYNSPGVASGKRYFEFEIPVEGVEKTDSLNGR